MERWRLAGSPKRKIYKRDNTAIKSVCQGEMCGTMHFMWISTRKGSRRDAGAPYSLRRSTTRREIGPCVDGVLMPPMATGKRKRRYSRIPLVCASLCGPFPPRRLHRHRGSLSSQQNKTLKKFSKMRKHLKARNLRVLFQKIFLKKRELGR